MKITVNMREAGKWTFYDVMVASAEGKEPFITIKDCKLINGSKGDFVSFPARKDDKDKYWPMVYASEGFQVEVIKAMRAAVPPKTDPRTHAERKKPDFDFDPPF